VSEKRREEKRREELVAKERKGIRKLTRFPKDEEQTCLVS